MPLRFDKVSRWRVSSRSERTEAPTCGAFAETKTPWISRWKETYMDVSENSGTPKSSILIGFSIINHPFWGTPIFGNTHIWNPPPGYFMETKCVFFFQGTKVDPKRFFGGSKNVFVAQNDPGKTTLSWFPSPHFWPWKKIPKRCQCRPSKNRRNSDFLDLKDS